jgi:hypothetical protein
MLSMTFPLVQEPQLLMAVAENIYAAVELCLDALLERERSRRQIPAYHTGFEGKLDVFGKVLVPRYGLKTEYIEYMRTLKNLIRAHDESAVEFSRKDALVICSDRYDISTISAKDLQSFVNKAKLFIHDTNKVNAAI